MVRSGSAIRFYGINTDYKDGKQTAELPPLLYRFDPQDGSLQVMADDFQGPNGRAFSPDKRLLYVAESGRQLTANPSIRVFDVLDSGKRLSPGSGLSQDHARLYRRLPLDQDRNVWSTAADGVHCIAPDGTKLGSVKVPFTVSNLTCGGRNRSRPSICASQRYLQSTPTTGASSAPDPHQIFNNLASM